MKDFTFNQYGIPVQLKSVPEYEKTDSSFYRMKLCHVKCTKDGIVYEPAVHIFTEKELTRAAARYYNECTNLENIPYTTTTYASASRGYVGIRTYINSSGALTTRYVIRFDASKITEAGGDVCVGLFTAREMMRSASRVRWFRLMKMGWLGRLWVKLSGKKND